MGQLTFNPNATPESTSVDGYVQYGSAGGTDVTFSTARNAAGDGVDHTSASALLRLNSAQAGTGHWQQVFRGVFLFDTSSLGVNLTISSATLQLYVTAKHDPFTPAGAFGIVQAVPASNTTLVNADYNIANWTMVRQATDLTIASITTSAYNTWTLNATGISNINRQGITKFGVTTAYDIDNSEPSAPGPSSSADITVQTAEGANPPILTVTYAPIAFGGII